MSRQTPDYGLDAPVAFRAMFIIGLAGAIVGFLIVQWSLSRHPEPAVRTVNQGGQVAISDIHGVGFYADQLRKSDMTDVETSGLSFWTFPPVRTVTARKLS